MQTPAASAQAVTSVAAADPRSIRKLTRRITLGGLLTALILLLVIATRLAPTADLAIFSVTSLLVAVAVIEADMKTAGLVFAAAALLGLAYPGIAYSYPFILLFGPYPLIRAILDQRFRRLPALLLKLAAGNLLAVIAAALFAWPALTGLASQYGNYVWFVLPILLQVILLVFDYALSLLIQFYMIRIRRH